jgi:uncharacterized protein YecT (DUF1311 family)
LAGPLALHGRKPASTAIDSYKTGDAVQAAIRTGCHMTNIVALLLIAVADPCGGSTTPEVERCLAADLARADAELNRYYTTAMARLAKDRQTATVSQLRASERAWVAYRDAECDAVYEQWKDGTIRGAMALGCRLRVTKARTNTIWRNWLTYADSTPPLLPRPGDGD